jgi:sugar lactone lactonase YvrE
MTGKCPISIAISPDGSSAYVADWRVNGNEDTVTQLT